VRYRAKIDLRAHWHRLLLYALLVGTITGVLLACLAGARRTDSAYGRLRAETAAADLYVASLCNPLECTAAPIAAERDEIEALPGVESAVFLQLYNGIFESAGRLVEGEDSGSGEMVVVASTDPRWGTSVNRVRVLKGRSADPSNPSEVVVGVQTAADHDLEVGDELIATIDDNDDDVAEVILDLEVVGTVIDPIGVRPPAGGQYARAIFGTPALAATHTTDNTGFAVTLEPDADAAKVFGGTRWSVFIDLDANEAAVDSGTDNDSLVLLIVAIVGAIGSLTVLGPIVSNASLAVQVDAPRLRALGFTRRDLLRRAALHGAALAIGCLVVSVVVAIALSPLAPIAEARRFEPDRGVDVDAAMLLPGAALGALAAFALVVAATLRGTRQGRTANRGRSALPALLGARRLGPTSALGVRVAVGRANAGSSGVGSLAAVALGTAAVFGALTFMNGLDDLRTDVRLVGITFDEFVMFDSEDVDHVAATVDQQVARLLADRRVDTVTSGTFFPPSDLEIDGRDSWVISYVPGPRTSPPFAVTSGRAPVAEHEVLLHPDLLHEIGALGDTVQATLFAGQLDDSAPAIEFTAEYTVVGAGVIAVDDRFKVTGALTLDGLRRLVASEPDIGATMLPYVVHVEYRAGLDREETSAALVRDGVIDAQYVLPWSDRPAEEVIGLELEGVDRVPRALVVFFALLGGAVLAISIADRASAWRRRLAIYRALGLSGRQSAGAIAIASLISVALCIAVALPLGIAAGRAAWSRHAENLGVVVEAPVPWTTIAVAAAIALVVGLLVALRPAVRAASRRVLRSLRAE
jgi:hypothetical protein